MKQPSVVREDMTMKTHYNEFVHPNLEEDDEVVEDNDGTLRRVTKRRGCIERFNEFDDTWLRPCCIYKYNKLKKRQNFEFVDMLDEYRQIQDELNNGSDSEDEVVGDFSRTLVMNDASITGRGLLAQYVASKKAREERANSNNQTFKGKIGAGDASISLSNAKGGQNSSLKQFSLAGSRTMKMQEKE